MSAEMTRSETPGAPVREQVTPPQPSSPIDVLLRKWRVIGLLAVILWIPLAALFLLFPKYECTATVALGPKGVTLAVYKKLEDAILDTSSLAAAFRDAVPARTIEEIQDEARAALSPRMSGPRDEIKRSASADVVAAVRISNESRDRAHAEHTVQTLAVLLREGLTTIMAVDELDTIEARTKLVTAESAFMTLAFTNQSLDTLEGRLKAIARDSPGESHAPTRELVNIADGGYRYLPLPVQLVGVKALQADNEHQIRIQEYAVKTERLRIDFYRQFAARFFEGHLVGAPPSIVYDVPKIARRELDAFVSTQKGPEVENFLVYANGFVKALEDHHSGITYLSAPASRQLSAARSIVVSAVLALIVSTVAMLLASAGAFRLRAR
jgi:hypothetical protein